VAMVHFREDLTGVGRGFMTIYWGCYHRVIAVRFRD